MRKRHTLGTVVLALLLAAGCDGIGMTTPDADPIIGLTGNALPTADCRNVRGSGTAALVSPLVAEGTMQGDLAADLRATRTDLIDHGQGAAHSQQLFLPASIHVQRWEFETADPDGAFEGADFSGTTDARVGPLDAVELTAVANARIEISDGASGHLLVHGVVDFSGLPTLEFRYHGRLCGA